MDDNLNNHSNEFSSLISTVVNGNNSSQESQSLLVYPQLQTTAESSVNNDNNTPQNNPDNSSEIGISLLEAQSEITPAVINTTSRRKFILQQVLRVTSIVLPLIISFPFLFFDIVSPGNIEISRCIGVTILTSCWWITETVPLGIGALLPFVLFPVFGIIEADKISAAYFNESIFLFMGTFLVAIAIEEWNLHKRIAIGILILTRTPFLVLGGFIFCAYFLSMFLSNTSTTAMLVPMSQAIVTNIDAVGKDRFSKALFMAIPYSSTIGGIATLVGTPTNIIFIGVLKQLYPTYGSMNFFSWLLFCLPLSFLFIVSLWLFLSILFLRGFRFDQKNDYFTSEFRKLGCLKYEEIVVFILFLVMCLLWMTRDMPFGDGVGWGLLFKKKFVGDGTVSCFVALCLFLIPSYVKKGKSLLDWETVNRKMPWNIILLLASGFALGKAFEAANMNLFFETWIAWMKNLPPYLLLLLVCTIISIATEFMSNIAIANISMPILGVLAPKVGQNPLFFMIGGTLVSSFAFMGVLGTPGNSIAFGYGYFRLVDLCVVGFFLNFLGIALVMLFTWLLGGPVFGIEIGVVPIWANQTIISSVQQQLFC